MGRRGFSVDAYGQSRALFVLVSIVFQVCTPAIAGTTATACHSLFWPASSAIINPSFSIPKEVIAELTRWSQKLLLKPTCAISVLASSGKTDIKDPELIASRNAIDDADHAAVLALTYRLTQNIDYLNKTKEILIGWAKVNQPTGNPIDETRLEGMLWAYDLIACDLSEDEKVQILHWFECIHAKKNAWKFGPITGVNNYRIHQLKILLLLDKILHKEQDWTNDLEHAEKYSTINLNPESGISIDYYERTALYYHNYVLQPWLEISLITNCCQQPVTKAFSFLQNKILAHDIDGEFAHSQAKIDMRRAKGGFEYARKSSTFDVERAAPTIVMYYTLNSASPDQKLWFIQQQAKPSPWLVFLTARRLLWQ